MSAELLCPEDLGKLYGVCGRTIRRWHVDGKIPAEVYEGKIVRFDPDAVAVALKQRAKKAAKTRSFATLA